MQLPSIAVGTSSAQRGSAISGDGRFLYVSNRGDNTIITYTINKATGRVTELQRTPCGGQTPWSFTLHPSGQWMIVANAASNALVVFRIDPASGRLAATGQTLSVPTPVVMAFHTRS